MGSKLLIKLASLRALLYDEHMKGCLGFVLMLMLVGFAGVTLAFNFLINQNLDFEEKSNIDEVINVRRSFRPLENAAAADEVQAVEVE